MIFKDKNNNYLPYVVPSLVIISSLLILYILEHSYEKKVTKEKISIAKVFFFKNDTKRKTSERVIWQGIAEGEALYKSDSIRTSLQSEAIIRFNDGSQLELDENSMVVLEPTRDRLAINFIRGNVVSEAASDMLEIKLGDAKLKLNKGQVRLEKTKSKKASVSILKGNIQYEDKNKKVNLKKNQRAILKEDGGFANIEEIPFELKTPEELFKVYTSSMKKLITFQWDKASYKGKVRVDISRERDFKLIYRSISTTKTNAQVMVSVGDFYWRVSAVGGNKTQYSDTRKFSVIKEEHFKLFAPVENENYQYIKKIPLVGFSWDAPIYFKKKRIQVASDAGFNNLVYSVELNNENKYFFKLEEEGKYFWRLQAQRLGDNAIINSEARTFYIKKIAEPKNPKLIEPKHKSFVAGAKDNNVVFMWEAVPEVLKYFIEIAKDQDFKKTLLSTEVQGINFTWQAEEKAKYFWRVSPIDFENNRVITKSYSSFNFIGNEELKIIEPNNNEKLIYDDFILVNFKWKQFPFAKKYLLEVSKDKNFNIILERIRVGQAERTLNTLAPGAYFWRVKAYDLNGQYLKSSAKRRVLLETKKLVAPKLIVPTLGYEHKFFDKTSKTLSFKWDRVPGAKFYEFIIEKKSRDKPFKFIEKTSEASINVNLPEEGTYTWGVRAINAYKEYGILSEKFDLLLTKKKYLPPPSKIKITQ